MVFVMKVYALKERDDNFLLKIPVTSLGADIGGPQFKYGFLYSELQDLGKVTKVSELEFLLPLDSFFLNSTFLLELFYRLMFYLPSIHMLKT